MFGKEPAGNKEVDEEGNAVNPRDWMMTTAIVFAEIVVIGLILFCTVEFIVLIGMGDFCMNPEASTAAALPFGTPGRQAAQYYGTCVGQSPVQVNLQTSYAVRTTLGSNMNLLYNPNFPTTGANPNPPCFDSAKNLPNMDIFQAYLALQSLHTIYEAIDTEVSCSIIHPILKVCVEYAACIYTFAGIYALWWSQFFIIFGLFLLMISGSILQTYFTHEYWNISSTVESDVKVVDREENERLVVDDDFVDVGEA